MTALDATVLLAVLATAPLLLLRLHLLRSLIAREVYPPPPPERLDRR